MVSPGFSSFDVGPRKYPWSIGINRHFPFFIICDKRFFIPQSMVKSSFACLFSNFSWFLKIFPCTLHCKNMLLHFRFLQSTPQSLESSSGIWGQTLSRRREAQVHFFASQMAFAETAMPLQFCIAKK